jgi:hypothetical protein
MDVQAPNLTVLEKIFVDEHRMVVTTFMRSAVVERNAAVSSGSAACLRPARVVARRDGARVRPVCTQR